MSGRQTEECNEAEENEEPQSGKWSTAQTDALVYAWRDCFVDLESHKNPAAWRTILQNVNETGSKKSMDQVKKKLRNLKDRYKEAKEKNKKSGGARNLPKYFAVFDEVLGTRSVVRLNEVRESMQTHQFHNPRRMISKETEGPVQPSDLRAEDPEQGIEEEDKLPKRTKKKRASKSAASTQLVELLGEVQRQQNESMKQFLDAIQKMEDNSRKHTEDTLVRIAQIFSKQKKGKKRSREDARETSSEHEEESG